MSKDTTIRRRAPVWAAALLAGAAAMPAAIAQTNQPPGRVSAGEVQRACEFDPEFQALDCPSQTASSTGRQLFNFVDDLSDRISQQRRVLRDSRTGSSAVAGGSLLGGAAGADSDVDGIAEYGRLSTFGVADYTQAKRNSTAAGLAYDQEDNSAVLGFDYRFGNSLFAGATLNYLSGNTDFIGNSGSTDLDSYVFGVHGSKYWDNDAFVEALITYGRLNLDIERVDSFDQMRYDASPDGKMHSLDLAAGYTHSRNRWRVTPMVKLLYLDGSIDAYAENDPSGVGTPQTFEEQDFDALDVALSLQTDYVVLRNWGVLIPSLQVAYYHEFSDPYTVYGTRFGFPFGDKTDDSDHHTAVVRAGVSAQFTHGWSGFASYEKLFMHRYFERNNAVVGVRYEIP